MIRDKNTEWLEKAVYIPAQSFQGQIAGVFTTDTTLNFAEIAAADITAPLQTTTAGGINHCMRVPYDLDRSKAIRFRVWWTINVTDADVETPVLVYAAIAAGAVIADAATVLDTAIPAYTFNGTANAAEVTDFGVIKKNTLLTTTEFLQLKVTTTFNTASTNEISYLGLEMRYTPRKTGGPEKNIRAGRRLNTTAPLGVTLNATQENAAGSN